MEAVPELHGWLDPMGRRMQKVEMAVMRNATHSLNPEEREAILLMKAPCVALREWMSASEDSLDDKELLVIPKKTTEVTTMEIDPFDKMQTTLSKTFGRKQFDIVDTLGGFERVDAQVLSLLSLSLSLSPLSLSLGSFEHFDAPVCSMPLSYAVALFHSLLLAYSTSLLTCERRTRRQKKKALINMIIITYIHLHDLYKNLHETDIHVYMTCFL